MDPITTAIVAALASGMSEVGKEGILDAYNVLKSLLYQKFGPQSKVFKAVEDLEDDPDSPARTAVLQEEVSKAKADQDPDLRRTAYNLSLQAHRFSQNAPGNRNIQIQGGRDVNLNRLGPIVILIIAVVAIFAFLIWQLFPYATQSNKPPATPTPTPITATPDGTLTDFCTLVRSSKQGDIYQDLYSDNLKKQITVQKFNQEWGGVYNVVSSCVPTITSSSGTAATGVIAVQKYFQDQVYNVTLIKKDDGQWAIDSIQRTSAPASTQTASSTP